MTKLESRNYYYFHVNLLLCVYQLRSLIQNLLRRRQKDLLIVRLPGGEKQNNFIKYKLGYITFIIRSLVFILRMYAHMCACVCVCNVHVKNCTIIELSIIRTRSKIQRKYPHYYYLLLICYYIRGIHSNYNVRIIHICNWIHCITMHIERY